MSHLNIPKLIDQDRAKVLINGWFRYDEGEYNRFNYESGFLYFKNGNICCDGVHPTYVSKSRKMVVYYKNHLHLHRLAGPAIIDFKEPMNWNSVTNEFEEVGSIILFRNYIDGEFYPPSEFKTHPEVIKYNKKQEIKLIFRNID